jgi:hypothetical protein
MLGKIKENRPIFELDIRDNSLGAPIIMEMLNCLKDNYMLSQVKFSIPSNITQQILNSITDLELLYQVHHE